MTPDVILGLVLALFGSIIIFCMIKNFDFMFESTAPGDKKFNALVEMFGRDVVRVMFSLLGVLLIVLGILGATGKVKLIKPKNENSGSIQSVGRHNGAR